MFAGVVPFKGRTQEQTFEKIKLGEFEMPKSIPATAQDLVKKLIVLQPENRLGATNI
jgi:serine/threonine protein kinase